MCKAAGTSRWAAASGPASGRGEGATASATGNLFAASVLVPPAGRSVMNAALLILSLTQLSRSSDAHHPYFTNKKMEAQEDEVTCPRE